MAMILKWGIFSTLFVPYFPPPGISKTQVSLHYIDWNTRTYKGGWIGFQFIIQLGQLAEGPDLTKVTGRKITNLSDTSAIAR